jgi:hypothetical protein
MSPQVSWLFFEARAKRPSRPIFASCFYGHSAVGAKMERDGSSEQRGKTANRPGAQDFVVAQPRKFSSSGPAMLGLNNSIEYF